LSGLFSKLELKYLDKDLDIIQDGDSLEAIYTIRKMAIKQDAITVEDRQQSQFEKMQIIKKMFPKSIFFKSSKISNTDGEKYIDDMINFYLENISQAKSPEHRQLAELQLKQAIEQQSHNSQQAKEIFRLVRSYLRNVVHIPSSPHKISSDLFYNIVRRIIREGANQFIGTSYFE
jgi:hypothetical protein